MSGKPSFQISDIHLLESHFKRDKDIEFNHSYKNNVSIETGHDFEQVTNRLSITVILNYSAGFKGKKYITAKIIMLGVFSCSPDAQLSVDQFSKANGPAIMFPFLREHLASISLKSGVKPIILPAINFIKLVAEDKIKNITKK
ncbi:protein-export chaperone SecB [Pedobacter sp. ISL-68]|uniref:protein-export chaperone SecB n=1 Tax=unclassified Pedobacter TaxID=2628915 RepID=UPI001BECFF3F|nr:MULTISPECIES: protein-export chaperone SecB [unclassified Pedobacter]MBT2560594.1 protein-export chaperone SecB [Pedobacter sp. ISL-64]MBT2589973.1 protein-export chaperone SecB [Pedobacter sp. ISL-68]